jgi:hypothetical protein
MTTRRLVLALALVVVGGCRASRWRPADPRDPDLTVCCTGTLTAIRNESDGVIGLDVRPRPDSQRLLSPGRSVVTCEVTPEVGERFSAILPRLRAGVEVEICGYWITDDQRPGLRLIRPVTSIDDLIAVGR